MFYETHLTEMFAAWMNSNINTNKNKNKHNN